MGKIIQKYGEVIPNYYITAIENSIGGENIVTYQLHKLNEVSIFSFNSKPISIEKFLKENDKIDPPCFTGWVWRVNKELTNFKFTPKIGYELFTSILDSGYDIDKFFKEKNWDNINANRYLYQKIATLIENV
jgi:hypothetical protein